MPNRRPRLSLHGAPADEAQAATIMAAVERFLRDLAPPRAAVDEPLNPWTRTALLEGAERGESNPSAWGDPTPWR